MSYSARREKEILTWLSHCSPRLALTVNAIDERGSTPLLEAARYGHEDVCRVLIAAGAILKSKDRDGKTAVMLAVQGDHDEVVRVLKQAGEIE